jgi:hypothetical protein
MTELAQKDACALLDADHLAVKHLFVEYARLATPPDPKTAADRKALADRICTELTIHAQIEEEIFYPALATALGKDRDLLDEAKAEHDEARRLIARIQALAAANDEMDRLVVSLNQAVEHHVKEERDELFPKARASLDLHALGQRLRERQSQLEGEG